MILITKSILNLDISVNKGKNMNKQKSAFRKCAYCPHHNQETKCCCKSKNKSMQKLKKVKPKNNNFINQSSIRYADDSQMRFQQINLSNLIAQNSMLKYENNNLKNDLLSISHCINEERAPYNKQYSSVNTCATLKTQSEQILSDRLYISNKNLQEAIFQVDNLSKKNKELLDKNSILSFQMNTLNLQNEELKEDILILKKQIKKEQENSCQSEMNSLKENYKSLRLKYENLKMMNSDLNGQIQKLKLQLSKKNSITQQNMSPQWVAETSNKLSFIEQKIDNAENRFRNDEVQKIQKSQLNYMPQFYVQNNSNGSYFQVLHEMKKQIALAINTIHSRTRKFNPVFDTIGNVENINATQLICTLIQGFVQSCINLNLNIERQLNRKISVLQKRMENLLGKLQNFVLEVKNRQLRKRSTSRSRILLKNKSGLSSRNPYPYHSNKENINVLNNLDTSY